MSGLWFGAFTSYSPYAANIIPGYSFFSLYNYAVFITNIITLFRPCSQGLACPDDELRCRYRLSRQEAKGAWSVIRPVWLRKVSRYILAGDESSQ
jgi:hypothetical protein